MNRPTGLLGGFLTQVRHRPDATALIWRGEHTTYRALYEAAGRERERFAVLGIAPGDTVGILARTSPAAIALVLACLLSKRPFLLPPPALPAALLNDLFARAGCTRVLTPGQDHGQAQAQGQGQEHVVPVRRPAGHVPGYGRGRRPARATTAGVPHRPAGEPAAFMLAASGSGGPPRIVPLDHRAVDRCTGWAAGAFGIEEGTNVLSHAPLHSGLSLLDIWTSLASGATVVIAQTATTADGPGLLELFTRHGVHVVQGPPALYGLLADAARRTGTTLDGVRHAVFTKGALPDRVLAVLPHLFPGARLHNVYGCTETGASFIHEVDTGATVFPPVPIGRPLPGVRALVVDARGTPVKGPGTGELYVATPFRSPGGHLNRTRRRTTPTPTPGTGNTPTATATATAIATVTGTATGEERTWFRTGDLVRRDVDGLLHLAGRGAQRTPARPAARRTAGPTRPTATTRHAGRTASGRRNELIPDRGRTS